MYNRLIKNKESKKIKSIQRREMNSSVLNRNNYYVHSVAQRSRQSIANKSNQVNQLKSFQELANNKLSNNTNLPSQLKSGIENLSGISMDDVKVHYNSSKPAQLYAHAYAQGTDIHLGPGQEKHLPHEAWHVVQQKQGRVKPTMQMKGKVNVNDDVGLEREADVMGVKAMQMRSDENLKGGINQAFERSNLILQRVTLFNTLSGGYQHLTKDRKTETPARLGREGHDQDEKTSELKKFATAVRSYLNSKGYFAGPHIAVSVQQKRLYIAVNTKFSKSERLDSEKSRKHVDSKILHAATLAVVKSIPEKTDAEKWIKSAGLQGIHAQGFTDWGSDQNHGEMRILNALLSKDKRWEARNKLASRGELPKDRLKVIRIGGELRDCMDCNSEYHKRAGELEGKGFKVLSPGTAGGEGDKAWKFPMASPTEKDVSSTPDMEGKIIGRDKEDKTALADNIEKAEKAKEAEALRKKMELERRETAKRETALKQEEEKQAKKDFEVKMAKNRILRIKEALENADDWNGRKFSVDAETGELKEDKKNRAYPSGHKKLNELEQHKKSLAGERRILADNK